MIEEVAKRPFSGYVYNFQKKSRGGRFCSNANGLALAFPTTPTILNGTKLTPRGG